MKRTPTRARLLAGIGLFVVLIITLVVIGGCMRYGGPEGLVRRARAEIAQYRPHPDFVPTPLVPVTVATALAVQMDPTAEPTAGAGFAPATVVPFTPTAEADLFPDTAEMSGALTETVPATAAPVAPAPTTVPTPTATPPYLPAAPGVELKGVVHAWQTWNNCGPATLAMNLSYHGSTLTQADVAATLRPDNDDKNVNPEEMAAFVRSQGYEALVRVNGNADQLRLLLSNGFPVLIETWLEPEPNDGMGHYRLLTGYDDAAGHWIAFDSYEGKGLDMTNGYPGLRLPYTELDNLWAVFNRTYLVVFKPEQAPLVQSILGNDFDDTAMWGRSLERAAGDVAARPQDPFAYFNLGASLTALGRYEEAAAAFDQARVIGLPWRMLWYQFSPFQAYYAVGRYQEVVALADATLRTVGNVEELHYWRGLGLQALGDTAGARQAWERAVRLNPNYADPAAALAELGQ